MRLKHGTEGRRHYAAHALLQLARPGLAHAVAHQVDGASLPGGAPERLFDGADQALVRIGGHEPHAVDAASSDAAQEPEP